VCTAAIDGYYLEQDNSNKYTGKVKACKSTCATCSQYGTCDTCQTNYNKVGTSCVYYQFA
jgi:hypothetical protein